MQTRALIILTLITLTRSLNVLPSETYLRTVNQTMNGEPINGVSMYFGANGKLNKMISNFDLQLGYPHVVVGNKKEVGFGMICGDGKENIVTTCEYDKVGSNNFLFHCGIIGSNLGAYF